MAGTERDCVSVTHGLRCLSLGVALVGLLLVPSRLAFAQESDAASALSLFEEGKQLADTGHWAEGCPKLQASYKLVPKLGTLLNLADCYEKLGKTATAWVLFTEAKAMAERAHQEERIEFARTHATALAPRLSRLTVMLGGKARSDVVVKRDGVTLDPALLGVASPVDPGPHLVEASAPGLQPCSTTVVVAAEGEGRNAVVSIAFPEEQTTSSLKPADEPMVRPSKTSWSTQKTVGVVVGVGGVGGIGAALILGAMASSRYSQTNTSRECVNKDVYKRQ